MSIENKVKSIEFSDEISNSYIDYSISALKRTIPDIRDGLKPVQRRILFSMFDCGYKNDKQFRKCARVVGDVMGRFHPHGDSSIYKALVRMAQNFATNAPLISGQGNFGSIDGDEAGAQRYTECKLSLFSDEMMKDLSEQTVPFENNYDSSLLEPEVLPFKIPHILLNGAIGIAVGYATNIPQHNLSEIIDALCLVIDNENASVKDLMEHIHGPDFPTGGYLHSKGIYEMYSTGKGTLTFRSKVEIDDHNNSIIISSIPFGVNKLNLIEEICEYSKMEKIQGIDDVIDDTFKDNIRILIKLKPGFKKEIIINQLNKYTSILSNYSFSFLLMNGQKPSIFNLKDILVNFLKFRRSVLQKKFLYDLTVLLKKAENLFGILAIIKNQKVTSLIDEIMASSDSKEAISKIMSIKTSLSGLEHYYRSIYDNDMQPVFSLSNNQAMNILNMKLISLTKIEKDSITSSLDALCENILTLKKLTKNVKEVDLYIKNELIEIKNKFGKKRNTEIIFQNEFNNIKEEDLLHTRKKVVVIYDNNDLKIFDTESFKIQHKGGQGKNLFSYDGIGVKKMVFCANKDTLLFFSTSGTVHSLSVIDLESLSGKKINSVLNLLEEESIEDIITTSEHDMLFFVTKKGMVKKHSAHLFSNVRGGGKKAITMDSDDSLIRVIPCNEDHNIFLVTKLGMSLMISVDSIRLFKTRDSVGVRGIKLNANDEVIYAISADTKYIEDSGLFVITTYGYGRIIKLKTFGDAKNRNTKGLTCIKKNKSDILGNIVSTGLVNLTKNNNISIVTTKGRCINIDVKEIPILGKNTMGNKLIKLEDGDFVKYTEISEIVDTQEI